MNLGMSEVGNNWKLILGNFVVVFFTQFFFKFDDIINTGCLPTQFEIVKITSNSVIACLIFYGFNRVLNKEKT